MQDLKKKEKKNSLHNLGSAVFIPETQSFERKRKNSWMCSKHILIYLLYPLSTIAVAINRFEIVQILHY